MRNFFGSPAKKLRSFADIEDYLHEEEGSAIAFFDKENENMKKVYDEVAAELRTIGFYFGYVTDPKLRSEYPQYDKKILYIRADLLNSVYEDKISIYQENLNTSSLQRWMIKEQQGLMGFRTSNNDYLFQNPLVVVYIPLILDFEYAAQATINTLRIRENLMSVAQNYSEKVSFAISDKKQFKYELRNCGYDYNKIESSEPLVCMFRDEDRFNMKMKYSIEAFSEAIDRFLAGSTQR